MLEEKEDEIFLSRWSEGKLSQQELDQFKKTTEYKEYQKILAGADLLELRAYDTDNELAKIKSKTTPKKTKNVVRLWPYLAAAASIAIIFGIFLFGPSPSYSTNYGEKLTVTLPDGSEMTLNARSKASFDEKEWKNNRTVNLDGEAFFKVKKGSKFTVITTTGEVSVLGTQFNVNSENSLFEVRCFEGKVSVAIDRNKEILTKGKALRSIEKNIEKWEFESTIPSWVNNTSTFSSIPVRYVLNELEEQYDIKIKKEGLHLTTQKYTGSFPNDNIEIALNTVFSTLGIEYSLSQDGKTVVLEK